MQDGLQKMAKYLKMEKYFLKMEDSLKKMEKYL